MSRWMSDHFGGSTVEIVELGEDTKVWWTPESNCLDVPGVRYVTFPLHKPPAHLTLDDRALTFDGTWPRVEDLLVFRPWNKGGSRYDLAQRIEKLEEVLGRFAKYYELNDCHERAPDDAIEVPVEDLAAARALLVDRRS